MALDLQQRPPEHGHRRVYTRTETENGRVVLRMHPVKNGGITGDYLRRRSTGAASRDWVKQVYSSRLFGIVQDVAIHVDAEFFQEVTFVDKKPAAHRHNALNP